MRSGDLFELVLLDVVAPLIGLVHDEKHFALGLIVLNLLFVHGNQAARRIAIIENISLHLVGLPLLTRTSVVIQGQVHQT